MWMAADCTQESTRLLRQLLSQCGAGLSGAQRKGHAVVNNVTEEISREDSSGPSNTHHYTSAFSPPIVSALGPEIGPDISNTSAHFFLEVPIISQIMITLRKKRDKLDMPTGLKMDQPIWHLPEMPHG